MNLQMNKDLKPKVSYDYWKPYFYEKAENLKRFSSLFSTEADTSRVSVQESSPNEGSYKHKCNVCGKSFNSGKALCGHSRSHSQASKKKFSNNSKEGTSTVTYRSFFNDGDDEKNNHTCYVCKKIFPTNKALYGHMRSHPDRVFKGISPPTSLSHKNNKNSSLSNSLSSNSEDQEDGFAEANGNSDSDLSPKGYSKPLPMWKKRDKRGRKVSESYQAAMNLLHLSRNNTNYLSCSGPIEKFEEKNFVESSVKRKREVGESSSSGKEHAIKKIKFVFGGSLKLGNKSDVVGTISDSHVLMKGKGLLYESEVNEKSLSEDMVGGPSKSAGSEKRLEIDLNEPYVMED